MAKSNRSRRKARLSQSASTRKNQARPYGSHAYGCEILERRVLLAAQSAIPLSSALAAPSSSQQLTITPTGFRSVEGTAFTAAPVATFTDSLLGQPASTLAANINWGDGSTASIGTISGSNGTFTILGDHIYAEEGTYTPTVTVYPGSTSNPMLASATATSASAAVVSDPAVVATALPINLLDSRTPSVVAVATFTDPGGAEPNPADPVPISAHYAVTIDWGDNSPMSTGSLIRNGRLFVVTGSHAYAGEGTYPITTTISHEGIVTKVMGTATVTDNVAILLLDPTGANALNVTGNGGVTVNNGGTLVDDSANRQAATLTGHGNVVAADIDVTGSAQTTGQGVFSVPVDHEAPTPDPLNLPLPPVPSTTLPAVNYSGATALTLSPGTYVGGIKITGKGSVTLLPGIYYMQGGGFSVTGQGSVTGTGVLLVNGSGKSAGPISLTGQGNLYLTAPTNLTGTLSKYNGVAILQDPSSTAGIDITGQGSILLGGTLYAPKAKLTVTGSGGLSVTTTAGHSQVILADLVITGQGYVIVNSHAPAPSLSAALANDTGSSSTDNVTYDDTVVGAVVTATSLGGAIASLKAGFDTTSPIAFVDVTSALRPDGTFLLTPAILNLAFGGNVPDGLHVLHLQAADAAGNTTATFDLSFVLDSTAPTVTLLSPAPATLTNHNITIAGQTLDSLSGVVGLMAQVDGSAYSPVTFDKSGNFQLQTTLALDGSADGAHTVRFIATDSAGNRSQTTTLTFTLETTPPAVTFDLDPAFDTPPVGDHMTQDSIVTLTGTTEPNIQVLLVQTGATTVSDASGVFHFTNVSLVAGPNPFTVIATDAAGNNGTAQQTITLQSSIQLVEGTNFRIVFQQTITVPSQPSILQFTYNNLNFAIGAPFVNDAFEAAISGPTGSSPVYTIGTGLQAFFNITKGLPQALAQGVEANGQTVSLDLSGLTPGSQIMLTLRLVNDDTTTTTAVDITDVHVQPGGLPTGGTLGPINLPVTTTVSPSSAGTSQNQPTVSIVSGTTPNGPVTASSMGSDVVHVTAGAVAGHVPAGQTALVSGQATTTGTTLNTPPGHGPFVPSTTMTLSTSAMAAGYALSNFATGFPTSDIYGPFGIALLGTGEVMVADAPGNVRVFSTDNDGQNASSFSAAQNYGNGNAFGIAQVGASIYMAQQHAGTIIQLNQTGTFNQTIVSNLPGATGLSASPDGHLFCSANGGIWEVDPIAKTLTLFVSDGADGLGVSNDGTTLYAESGGHIIGYNIASKARVFDSGLIPNSPDGLALGVGALTGTVFVNTNGGTVVRVDIATNTQTVIASGGSRGDFVEVDPTDGTLLLTQTDRILRLTAPLGSGFGRVVPNSIVSVTVNGVPVSSLDASGNFFSPSTIRPGQNNFVIVATDSSGQIAGTTLTLYGDSSVTNTSSVVDVAGSVTPVFGRTTFNETSATLYSQVAAYNAGQTSINDPLYVGVEHLSDPSVQVLHPDGYTDTGVPYFDYSGLVTGPHFNAGNTTAFRELSFFDPGKVQFSFDLVPLAQLNRAPQITSAPPVQAITGESYTYPVMAIDVDGDPITFALRSGPSAMTINASTGLITWNPATADIGNQSISITVNDGQGGTAEQDYTLFVTAPQPNSPPEFITTPVVDATLGTNSTSQSNSTLYGITSSVGGMSTLVQVDVSTGHATTLFAFPLAQTVTDLAYDSQAHLFVALEQTFGPSGASSPQLVIIDPISQTVSTVAVTGLPSDQQSTTGLSYDPIGHALLLTFGPNNTYVQNRIASVDLAGNVTRVSPTLNLPDLDHILFDPAANDYRIIDVNDDGILSINDIFGSPTLTQLEPNPNDGNLWGPAYSDTGQLFLAHLGSRILYTWGNGLPTAIGPLGTSADVAGMVFAPGLQAIAGYVYNSHAVDPDQDTVTYSLAQGPSGMTIDSTSGQVLWSPTAAALNAPNSQAADPTLPLAPGFTVSTYASVFSPEELSFDPAGALYVGNGGTPTTFLAPEYINRISPQGSAIHEYGDTEIGDPDSVLFDGSGAISGVPGSVLVGGTDSGLAGKISAIWPDGTVHTVFGPSNTVGNVSFMRFNQAGQIVFNTGNTIVTAGPGTINPPVVLDTVPSASVDTLVLDSRENIYVACSDGIIRVYDRTGALLNNQFAAGRYYGLAFGPGGVWGTNLYGITQDTGQLVRFDSTGKITTIGGGFTAVANGMAFGPDGALYLSDYVNNRVLRIAPTQATLGLTPAQYPVTITASDGRGGVATQSYIVTVHPDPTDNPPVIISKPQTSAVVGTGYTYDVVAVDAGNDPLIYSLTTAPSGVSIVPTTGVVSWTTPSLGAYPITVRVDDGRGGFDTQSYTLTVSNVGTGEVHGTVFDDTTGDGTAPPTDVFDLDARTTFYDGNNGILSTPIAIPLGATSMQVSVVGGVITDGTNQLASPDGLYSNGQPPYNFTDTRFNGTYDGVPVGDTTGIDPALMGIFFNPAFTGTPLNSANYRSDSGITPDPRAQATYLPAANQPFWIGDGYTSNNAFVTTSYSYIPSGTKQEFIVPSGATELLLGVGADSNLADNGGSYHVTVTFNKPLLSGWTVYLDENNNGRLDPGEPSTTTNSAGQYAFTGLPAGTYVVREVPQQGWQQTAPTSLFYSATISSGQIITGDDFGNHQIATTATNQPPYFTSPPPTVATVGTPLKYSATAVDSQNSPLTYDLAVAPSGMAVDPSTGILVWSPTASQVGYASVVLRVRDTLGGVALQSFQINVGSIDHPPVITSTPTGPAVVGVKYQYAVTAVDPDNNSVTFSLTSPPAGMVIDPVSGVLTWTPAAGQVGSAHVVITASDGFGGTGTQTFDLPVVATATNAPPMITSTPGQFGQPGQQYRYAVVATDPNGDPLSYQLTTAPTGMTITSTGLITWAPAASDVGSVRQVAILVSDTRGATATQSYAISVLSQITNQPPVITSVPPTAAIVGNTYKYSATATDADNVLVWSLDSAPAGMAIDPSTGILVWQPQANQLGIQQVAVRVTDGHGGFTTQNFSISVTSVFLPPNITSNPPTTASVGVAYSYAVAATDPNGSTLTYSLTTMPTGMTIDPASGLISWKPVLSEVGNNAVVLRATNTYGGYCEQDFTVVVSSSGVTLPPRITSTPPYTAQPSLLYSYAVMAVDPAGNPLHYVLNNGPTGMAIDGNTGILSWTPTAQQTGTFPVSLSVLNSAGASETQTYQIVSFVDHPPVITSQPVLTATAGAPYVYTVIATDQDNNPLTIQLNNPPAGMTVDTYGNIAWNPAVADIGPHPVQVTVQDNFGMSATQSYIVTVTADTTAPKVQIIVNPVANLNDVVNIRVSATDNVGVTGRTLVVDGQAVAVDANGVAAVKLTRAGDIILSATATDAAGNVGTATNDIQVIDPTDTSAPVAIIASPAEGTMVTSIINVTGTVSDSNLLYYTLAIAPADGSSGFQEIFRSTQTVSNGLLGTFDPTMLQDNSYLLRLYALNAGGHSSEQEVQVNVAGNLKLGNFTLSFTDLQVPVSGIPITVSRTYDTLNANQSEDFGYGWRLEFGNTNLQTSVPAVAPDSGLTSNGFLPGTRVYVTVPGGKREGFTFTPVPAPGLQGSFLGILVPKFVADPGVTDALSVDNSPISYNTNNGEFTDFYGDLPYNPADTAFGSGQYTLTTKAGIAYKIDGTTGSMQSVSDANGNKLTFSSTGITSSSGVQVTFQRDPQGRIIGVTDPNGKTISYAYDSAGDLVSVTDRDGNVTQFDYLSTPAHYLNQVIDPLGRTGLKSTYGPDGRLNSIVNADGKTVNLSFDPGQSLQTVTDALGNPTIYGYDDRGNITLEVAPDGGKTTRTYDANNNLLTETDPNGNTTSYTYDPNGNVLTQTDPMGNVTQYTYNQLNKPLTITNPLGNTTTNTFDSVGNLLTTTDSFGATQTYEYDAAGKPTSVTDAAGNVTAIQYDSAGYLTQTVDAIGHVTSYTYDSDGNKLDETSMLTTGNGVRTLVTGYTYDSVGHPLTETDAEGNTTTDTYDPAGELSTQTDAAGNTTKYIYDSEGRLIQTIYPDRTFTSTTYDAAGNRVSETDQAGNTTKYKYDVMNRLIETDYPDGSFAKTTYDLAGRVTAEIDALGNTTQYAYDADGNRVKVTDALGDVTTFTYNAAGQMVSQMDPLGHVTSYAYDAAGRKITTIFADGSTTSSKYDMLGRDIEDIDADGNAAKYSYDALGHLISVTDALGQVTTYAHDEAGDLITQTDADGHTTHYEYNGLGDRTATVLPMGQRSTTVYGPTGNVVSTTDFNGQTTTYTYDSMNRLIAKHFADGTSDTFTYTPTGHRASDTTPLGTTTYTYAVRDNLLSRTDPDGTTISYSYDANGNRLTTTTPAQTVTYTFDALNRMSAVSAPGVGTTIYAYDADGNLIQTNQPNGVVEIRQYDALNRVTLIRATGPGNTLVTKFAYTLDAAGNRIRVDELGGRSVVYTYDTLYRLTNESITDPANGNRAMGYAYDAIGNRLTRTDTVAGTTTYSYDANDRLLNAITGGVTTTYTYDANGNALSEYTSPTNNTTYVYDTQNRLIAATVVSAGSTNIMQYGYNADGLQVIRIQNGTVTKAIWDTSAPLPEIWEQYSPSGVLVDSYVNGLETIAEQQGSNTFFFEQDALGSTRALTNLSGNITDTYAFDAFGQTLSHTGSSSIDRLFTGESRDVVTGLDYLRARNLDANTGRFSSRDPIAENIRKPQSENSYSYVQDNPVNDVDPRGTFNASDIKEITDYATIANAVYTLATVSGWQRMDLSNDGSNAGGLNAAIYVSQDGRAVLAFKGTDFTSAVDWTNNVFQAIGLPAPEYLEGLTEAQIAKDEYGDNLILTGHSLGGGIADFAGLATRTNTVAFNAAGLSQYTIGIAQSLSGAGIDAPFIHNFNLQGDPVSSLINPITGTTQPGTQVQLRNNGWLPITVYDHSIEGIEESLGSFGFF